MIDRRSKAVLRNALGQIAEELSADAVIICVTRRRRKGTETILAPFGNIHTCRGLAEYAYGRLCEGDSDDDAEESEQIDDESE